MEPTKEKSVSISLPARDFAMLEEQARRHSSPLESVGRVMISRSLRALIHPAIDFQETPEGDTCARLAGRRISVWLVVDTLRRCAGDHRKAAEALNLPGSLLMAALKYAEEYPEEIEADTWRAKRTLRECGL